MDLERYLRLRPFAWHLTSTRNVARIRETGMLECAQELMRRAGAPPSRDRRKTARVVRIDQQDVVLRDQAPLHVGNIGFEEGWDFTRLLEHLDSHVFFWPGTAADPVPSGRRHFQRYIDAGEGLAFLRVDARQLVATNTEPRFSVCNSGSPRMNAGRRALRGAQTFVAARQLDRGPSEVVELVFPRSARLPPSTLVASSPKGPWMTLS